MTTTHQPAGDKTMTEYVIWGKHESAGPYEVLLVEKVEDKPITSLELVHSVKQQLAKLGCHSMRHQAINPAECPSNLFKSPQLQTVSK